jgi:predicted PurR-regulated permease PerM
VNQHHPLPQRYAMALLTAALIIGLTLCYFIALPFIPALVWSMTLAVMLAPFERWLRTKIGRPTISVSLTLVLAALMVVAPVILVLGALVSKLIDSTGLLSAMLSAENWPGVARQHPGLSPVMTWISGHLDLPELLQSLTAQLAQWGASLVQGSLASVVTLLLTFYFLFYLLRDRGLVLAAMERMIPLSRSELHSLINRLVQTIFASVYGTAAVAALQGFLGGMVFWWLGLPSPLFWGVIMGLLAVVPFLGAFVIWVPANLALALDGQWLSAAILAIWGTLVVGLVDNIVYPILVGRQLALHSVISFIAIVGGLLLFGPHGVVLGPLIVAAAQALLEIWRGRLDDDPSLQPTGG